MTSAKKTSSYPAGPVWQCGYGLQCKCRSGMEKVEKKSWWCHSVRGFGNSRASPEFLLGDRGNHFAFFDTRRRYALPKPIFFSIRLWQKKIQNTVCGKSALLESMNGNYWSCCLRLSWVSIGQGLTNHLKNLPVFVGYISFTQYSSHIVAWHRTKTSQI